MALKQDDMYEENRVSVFVGNIEDEGEFDDYLADEFGDDFGFEIDPEFAPECDVGKPVAIAKLLDGFTLAETYSDAIVALAKQKGIKTASCVMVFFDFEYDPGVMNRKASGKLTYVGAVDFPGFEEEE